MATRTILFATDYTPACAAALPVAEGLARDSGARLLIVHVSQTEPAPVGELFAEEPAPPPEELDKLLAVVPTDRQLPYAHRLVYGEVGSDEITQPAEQLLRLAETESAAMIVVGMHGREGLSRLMSGSVAETLIKRAPCPVVTVRPPGRASTPA